MDRRFRAIAPKPMAPSPLPPLVPPMGAAAGSVLWRPRKREREEHLLLPGRAVSKREREATTPSSSSSYPIPPPPLLAVGAGVVVGGRRSMPMPQGLLAGCEERFRRLSLVPPPAPPPSSDATTRRVFPVERDLISKLQVPRVIKPRPARPLSTTICIDSSSIAVGARGGGVAYPATVTVSNKTAREVETELELPGALPAIVSGHHNRVHLVNDAYKAMVGQPVCPWLDSLPGAGASRRINGVVVLDVRTFGSKPRLPNAAGSSDVFPCTARISWEQGGGSAIASLTVPCTVEHLTGRSGDYRFIWRFDSSRSTIIYCIS